jgi:SlyX protein
MEDRIVNIETKVAYLEHSVSELSEVMASQNQTVAELQKKLDVLIHMYRQLKDDGDAGDMPHEKPPHY